MVHIEIIHNRDPDAACDHLVFVDGVLIGAEDVAVYDVDPGRGWLREDWEQATEDEVSQASETVKPILRTVRENATNSTYVEER